MDCGRRDGTGQGNADQMSAEQTTSLMQRKARTGREAHAARAMSLARALRLTAAKEADKMMALPLGALSVTRRVLAAEDVPACVDTPWLTLLMDGPGCQVAAALLDPVLATGLIQQQTMGKVTPAPEVGETRRHTTTDAALCAPFIETLLARAALLPEEKNECELLQGYRFGIFAQEPRHAQLALDASSYQVIEMTLDMAAGTRTGKLLLILPEPAREKPEPEAEDESPASVPVQGNNLAENVMGLKADLTIALTRLKMPLKQVSALKVGEVVNLNLSSMAQALVLDANGVALTRGTLGQIDGIRALQVEQQKSKRYSQPRRRVSDRDELGLPDVTAPQSVSLSGLEAEDVHLPTLSDVDIFGDLDDLPDMPDMEEAEQAADAQMENLKISQTPRSDDPEDRREKQA